MSADPALELPGLRDFYRRRLVDDAAPFWLAHGLDRLHGGFITSLDRDGRILDTDKAVWFQGRGTWMYATLYNTVEKRPEWLEAARSGGAFMTRHCFRADGKMYFTVTREGLPLRVRRYVYSEAFAAMAFAAPSFPGWATKNWLPTLFSASLDLDMVTAGPLATITIAGSSLVGVIAGGVLADRWSRRHLGGRVYTSAIGLSLTVPALLCIGFGSGLAAVLGGAILFGVGYGMFDANNMPILCQFVSPRHRAAGYGLMNMTGVFAGALITSLLGRSTDAGHLGRDMALLAVPVTAAILLQLALVRPTVANRTDD